MFLLRAVLSILVRNASPRGPMCFRCMIFNLLVIIHLLISARQLFNFEIASNGCLDL